MADGGIDRKGIPAALAVLLAVLGIAYIPRKAAESSSGTATTKQTRNAGIHAELGNASNESQAAPFSECQAVFHQIRRFYAGDVSLPDSCYPKTAKRTKPEFTDVPDLHFFIAIVPNPVQTHLPLLFDRLIEAIQQAAQDEGYSYDASWFPWDNTIKDRDSLDDAEIAQSLEEEKHRQPGVLVFRRGVASPGEKTRPYSGGLIVFLVGEQPTGGIDDIQFDHALEWMDNLNRLQERPKDQAPCALLSGQPDQGSGPCEKLHILGPAFSGSLHSLARELSRKVIPRYSNSILVYSGSANSYASVVWFSDFLTAQYPLKGPDGEALYQFRTFFENDSLMTDRFLCYLQRQNYPLDRVAILSEDQTAFGSQRPKSRKPVQTDALAKPVEPAAASASPDDPRVQCNGAILDKQPINLYYPRDIAAVRSAYEKQSIFSAGQPQAGSQAPTTTLRGDLSEPDGSEHDAVRSYAGQLTPLAQESVLFGIANVLDTKHVDFVILRSTNPLDQLFLSEFLRRSYPSGRVVIDAGDLLFRRGMQGASLRGVMLLSTYPLLSWTQDALPTFKAPHSGSYRVFAQDTGEGLYIAARELFSRPDNPTTVPIPDYAAPMTKAPKYRFPDEENQPATWVSVVGHRQFWPLAILNSNTEPYGPTGSGTDLHDQSLLKPENGALKDLPDQQSGIRLPGEMVGLLILCLTVALCHLYCCRKGSIIGEPRVRAYFAPLPRIQHVVLIFLGSLIIGYLGVVLAFSSGLSNGLLARDWAIPVLIVIIAMVASGLVGCLANYSLPVLSPYFSIAGQAQVRRWRRQAAVAWPLTLVALVLVRKWLLTDRLTSANLFPTIWRSVYLRSGVSPLLPQVLLLLGMYAWFWFNLQGLAFFGADRPVLPRRKDLPRIGVPEKRRRGHVKPAHQAAAFRMFSQNEAGNNIEAAALPLTPHYGYSLLVFIPIVTGAAQLAMNEFSLRTLGDRRFGTMIFFWVCLCVAMLLADALKFLRTWNRLRRLLIFLDRLRLRRTLEALTGLSWHSVWKISGNVLEERYRLIARQFESMSNLGNILRAWEPKDPAEKQAKDDVLGHLKRCGTAGTWFADWYVNLGHTSSTTDLTDLRSFQRELAATAGCVMTKIILPAWHKETRSLLLKADGSVDAGQVKDKRHANEGDNQAAGKGGSGQDSSKSDSNDKPHPDEMDQERELVVRASEEFFVLPYLGFIQNTVGRIRSIAMGILALFVASTLAVSSYPFDPLPTIGAIFLITFLLVGAIVIFVYAEIHRDATLSRITNTRPGELGWDFWTKLVTFGVGPLIGLLTTLFPQLTDFVVSFLQPGAQAFK
jgi:hypothetical protein